MKLRLMILLLSTSVFGRVGAQVGPGPAITGHWVSVHPEKASSGNFSIRDFRIGSHEWEVKATLYTDSLLTSAVFTFRAGGKYEIGPASAASVNANKAAFFFDHKYVTSKTNDTALLRKIGLGACGLKFNEETDISVKGCAWFASSRECAQEYDLVSLKDGLLYLGARPGSGGMCSENKRPSSLGLPLRKIDNGGIARNNLPFDHIVDLTHTLNSHFPFIPTPVTYPFSLKPIATIDGFGVAANEWHIHEHIGTQIDAPNHFIKGGMSAEQLDVKDLIVPIAVIDISARAAKDRDTELTVEDILLWERQHGRLPHNAGVFMYSGWDKKIHSDEFLGMDSSKTLHFPGISKEAATFLVSSRNIAGVGVDVVSFDPGRDHTYQTHRVILGAKKWALECLANLDKIPASGSYAFIGAPKIESATGGLTRVIAIW